MTGWITAIFTGGPARKALGLLLAALTITLTSYPLAMSSGRSRPPM